ncbi:hypothetical protein HKD37_12G034891 [Glycine soja]
MRKCFSPLRSRTSCRVNLALSSNDDNHRTMVHSSADSRPFKCGKSRWQPALSIIKEDHVGMADDHQNIIDRKLDKKYLVAILPPTDDYLT